RRSDAFVPELSLVAVLDDRIVGHILLTKVRIKNEVESFEALTLAPVSVWPEHQRKGIGGQLIEAAHRRAAALGYKSVVLLGHADYYPRFGYEPCSKYGVRLPFDAADENCMIVGLSANALEPLSGLVEYPKAFFE
ncbi:MAG: N-acetyltransferase, partial [Bacteroidota bacterium]